MKTVFLLEANEDSIILFDLVFIFTKSNRLHCFQITKNDPSQIENLIVEEMSDMVEYLREILQLFNQSRSVPEKDIQDLLDLKSSLAQVNCIYSLLPMNNWKPSLLKDSNEITQQWTVSDDANRFRAKNTGCKCLFRWSLGLFIQISIHSLRLSSRGKT